MAAARHLHRDYSTAHCGKDISYLLATFDEKEATCKACKKGLKQFRADEAEAQRRAAAEAEQEAARIEAEKAEMARRQDEHRRRSEEALEERELARLKMERELGLRQ